ncbi:MAG: ABC transporter substrate-binding protein [Candidatus Odinarchaeota archaeon]
MVVLFTFSLNPTKFDIEKSTLRIAQTENVLFLGTDAELQELDPLLVLDSGSFDVIDQVAEGLFGYDYTDPQLSVIPRLAADHGTWDGNRYTVELKQGVQFHDSTPFDANAVKFTFDRLRYFLDNDMAVAGYLFTYYDEDSGEMKPIINNVNVLGEYVVEFELNIAFGLLETLLSLEGAFIVSPTSTPLTDVIDRYSGALIGTGPFQIEGYDPDNEISFRAFDNYWNSRANIDRLIFRYNYNADERADLLTSGELHMILSPPTYRRGEFEGNPDYTIDPVELNQLNFLGMNNHWINRDLREVISYAFDYDYLINEILGGEAVRAKSPIPNGIIYSDDSFNAPVTDIIHARTVMQSMGYGVGLDLYDDGAWQSSTFLSLNYSYNFGNFVREQIFYSLEESLGKIGIQVIDDGMEFYDFWSRLFELDDSNRDMLQLFWLGWGADYNDPSNIINNLFNSRVRDNNFILYDGDAAATEAGRNPNLLIDNVQLLMDEALIETNPNLREQYYNRIQELLIEEDMPVVLGSIPIREVWYNSEIQGFQFNSMRKLNFFGVTGIPYEMVDTTPPVTYISYIDGVWGWYGWFQSDVYVTLEAYDDLSGVYMTGYSFDGVNWNLYTGPILITESKTLYYASVDYNDNYEMPNSINILIDKVPPVTEVILSGEEGLNSWFTSEVLVTIVATDDNSGVAGSGYSFDGITTIPYTGPFILTESKAFGYGSADIAGNYDIPKIAIVNIDMIHPESTCTITGTFGTGDWYISDVMIELSAFDDNSGVGVIEYSYDGYTWNDYVDPLVLIESGVYDFYYRSCDIAGNTEPVSMMTFEIDKSPSAITEKMVEDLQNLVVPPSAQKEVNKAINDLKVALERFNDEREFLGLLEIHQSIKDLMSAQDNGADVQSIIDTIIEMVKDIAETAINEAIALVGEYNTFVGKAIEDFNQALVKVSEGEYDKAVMLFRNAYLMAKLVSCLWNIFVSYN